MMKSLRSREFAKIQPVSVPELARLLAIAGFLAFFFYRSVWAVLPMLIPAGMQLDLSRRKAARSKSRQLKQQFGECILSVEGAVIAGYAAENAFVESIKDMEMMYGADARIIEELMQIKGGLVNHVPLEKLLREMGQRTGLGEVQEFAEVFAITKRNGGSLAQIIRLTADQINGSLAMEEEILTLLASKRLEQKIMNLTPFLLVIYLQLTTPGYFDMFFRDVTGVLLMTAFLIWYITAYGLGEYILWKA